MRCYNILPKVDTMRKLIDEKSVEENKTPTLHSNVEGHLTSRWHHIDIFS